MLGVSGEAVQQTLAIPSVLGALIGLFISTYQLHLAVLCHSEVRLMLDEVEVCPQVSQCRLTNMLYFRAQ